MEEISSFYRRIRRIQMRVLNIAGLVPFENHSLYFIGTILMSLYVNFAFLAVSSVYIWTFIQDCYNKRFNPDITSELFSFLGFHLRYMYIFSRRVKLGKMLRYTEELWNSVNSEGKFHVRIFVRKISRLSVYYSGIILTTISLYVLSSQLPQWTAASTNKTVHRDLPYPFYIDVQNSPQYEILLGAQIICLLTITQTSVCVDTTIAFLIMIACGHFRLIQIRLVVIARHIEEKEQSYEKQKFFTLNKDKNVYESEKTDENIERRLRKCIVYHQEILDFCKDITLLSSEIFMIELISTTYNLSLIGILLAKNMPLSEKFKFAPVLLILSMQLFVCQYPPEILLQESARVAEAAYQVPPFKNDKFRLDKLFLILLMRSQKPYQMLAGGQIKLSIESFGNMIKGAFSFFTVLRNFN